MTSQVNHLAQHLNLKSRKFSWSNYDALPFEAKQMLDQMPQFVFIHGRHSKESVLAALPKLQQDLKQKMAQATEKTYGKEHPQSWSRVSRPSAEDLGL